MIIKDLNILLTESSHNNELSKGIKIEKEHKDLYEFFSKFCSENKLKMPITLDKMAEIIAKAHIKEIKDYYTRLIKMEKEAEKQS